MAMQALVLGFGGTGAHILTALKELTVLKYGRVPETIKFLLFDTIADWEPGKAVQIVGGASEERIAKSEDEAASLDPVQEYLQLTDFEPNLHTHVFQYLSPAGNPEQYPHLKDWLHAPWLSENVPQNQLGIVIGAAQQRQIGRFAMFKNADRILAHLRPIVRRLADHARGMDVNVWLIGSAAGGTGAGCLIDAAYLTRLAAEETKLKVTGVIVMPNVYTNVRGISQGRAYSFLRELERVQEQGVPGDDRYVDRTKRTLVSSRVVYDQNAQKVALVKARLFDDLFYLGDKCEDEDKRRKFFTSVAGAIDPYLDDSSGPSLLEKAVNETAAASAFGASRVYVPTETLTEIFAWEEVAAYLEQACAPQKRNEQVTGLHTGSSQDRSNNAAAKVKGLLKLFEELLKQKDRPEKNREAFARTELNAKQIVSVWYELTGGNRTPEEQAVLLTYVAPFYSYVQDEPPQDVTEYETKTFRENEKARGVKEKQEESKERFADKLEEVRKRYLNPAGGERTFEKGRRYVLETISQRLRQKVDNLFIEELARSQTQFASDPHAEGQGTGLTRLWAEVTSMLSDQGPLRTIDEVTGNFVTALAREEAERNNRYTRVLQELRDSKRGGLFSLGNWVDEYQISARDEASDFVRWHQKYELLKDMQQLVRNVRQRLEEWRRLLNRLFDTLVLREGRGEGEASALFSVRQIYLKGTLEERLYRAARNRSALISFGQQPDPEMHGYRQELRTQSAQGLAAALLGSSHWEARLTPESAPEAVLVIDHDGFGKRLYPTRQLRELQHDLYEHFRRHIAEKLGETDVFNYLLWLQEHRSIDTDRVVKALNAETHALINAGGAPETKVLVYKEPQGSDKKNLADALTGKLTPVDIERAYSDRNSITLIKVKKPSLNEIVDLQDCRQDYFRLRADQFSGDDKHDQELRRAQVFHPFRQELEAWYIERFYQKRVRNVEIQPLPPRLVRLLEDPEMLQYFLQGIATGAVEKVNGQGWVWHGPEEDLELTLDEENPYADVIKAGVIFALRQAEGARGGLRRILRDAAKQSVTEAAQKQSRSRDELLGEFLKQGLDPFLAEHAPATLRDPLKMLFTFYCDPKTRTGLTQRMNLP